MPVRHLEIKPFSWIYASMSIISRCNIDIYMGKEKAVVIVGQLPENQNPGIDITDGAVLIAASVMDKYGFTLDGLAWIECRDAVSPGNGGSSDAYERVFFAVHGGELGVAGREAVEASAVVRLISDPDSAV